MHYGKESLRDTDLPASAATAASDIFRTFGATGTVAFRASRHPMEFDCFIQSVDSIFKFDFQSVTEIIAILRGVGRRSALSAAEESVEGTSAAEEAVEDIERIAAPAAHSASFERIFAILIIQGAFFVIGEDFVCL